MFLFSNNTNNANKFVNKIFIKFHFKGDRSAASHVEESRNGGSRTAHREHKHVYIID
jgi:hypothetical protein